MGDVAGEGDSVAGTKRKGLAANNNRDRPLLDLQQLLGARRVRLALVLIPWAQRPAPEFNHIR